MILNDSHTEFAHDEPMAEINVTPLVDVMLVLLIIFMVTAPMMKVGIDVDLPTAKNVSVHEEERLIISMNRDGDIYLNEEIVNINLLPEKIVILSRIGNVSVFLQADSSIPYGQVIKVMDILKSGGVETVSLVMSPVERRTER